MHGQFAPVALSEIPDPEKLITETEIDVQVREALVSYPEFNGVSHQYEEEPVIDPRLWGEEEINSNDGIDCNSNGGTERHMGQMEFVLQQDFISLECEAEM